MTNPQIPDEAVYEYGKAELRCSTRAGHSVWQQDCCRRAGLTAAYPILVEQWRRTLDTTNAADQEVNNGMGGKDEQTCGLSTAEDSGRKY